MPDGTPVDSPRWLYDLLIELRQQTTEQYVRLRADLMGELLQLRTDIKGWSLRETENAERLAILETKVQRFETQAVPRGVWASILSSAVLLIGMELIRWALLRP